MPITGPSLLRNMLLFEAANNIPLAIALGLYPKFVMSFLLKPSAMTPATDTLAQLSSAFLFGLTVPLVLAYPEGRHAECNRRLAYLALGVSELAAIAYNLGYLLTGAESGWETPAIVSATGLMSVFFTWRVFVLFVKPAWMLSGSGEKKIA